MESASTRRQGRHEDRSFKWSYKFETSGKIYEKILTDRHILGSVVLISSYALIESAAKQLYEILVAHKAATTPIVSKLRNGKLTISDITDGGIEVWGTSILTDLGRDWNPVETHKEGIVEVAIARNAIAHGESRVTLSMVNRATAAGSNLPWALGSVIKLDIALVKEYRNRLRSFARVIENGAEYML